MSSEDTNGRREAAAAGTATDRATKPKRRSREQGGALRAEHDSGPTGPASKEVATEINGLVFDCERLLLYHSFRRQFLGSSHRWIMFMVVVFGSGAVVSFVGNNFGAGLPWLSALFGLVPPILGGLDLVFALSQRANDHGRLYERFNELRGVMVSAPETADALRRYQIRIHEIFAAEPPPMRALEAFCYNHAMAGRGDLGRLAIPGWQVLFKNFWPFAGTEYPVRNN